MSRSVRLLIVVLLTLTGAAVAVPSASAAACATAGGSGQRTVPALSPAPLVAVRTGRHTCFDRVVFEMDGAVGGYSVAYVAAVTQDGSGAVLPVPGGARLQVVLHHPAYDASGAGTYAGRPIGVHGYRTLRSVVVGGSFEGYTTVGVGTRARLPFRVVTLSGPGGHSRIVLDVAHRWT
jgi:hypothetical protein